MPDAFDHDHDAFLTKEEVEAFFDFLGNPEAAEDHFDAEAVVSTSSMCLVVEEARFLGDQGSQFDGMSTWAKELAGYDHNNDSIVSFREFLESVAPGLTYENGDAAVDVEEYLG